jgi:hypothetical protein
VRVIVEKLVEWRFAGEYEVLGENLPQRRHDGKPATNRLSYGAAFAGVLLGLYFCHEYRGENCRRNLSWLSATTLRYVPEGRALLIQDSPPPHCVHKTGAGFGDFNVHSSACLVFETINHILPRFSTGDLHCILDGKFSFIPCRFAVIRILLPSLLLESAYGTRVWLHFIQFLI